MSLKNVRYFVSVDRYNYQVDNRPLQDLDDNVRLVYSELQTLQGNFASALGDNVDLTSVVHVDGEGKISADVLPLHSADLLYASDTNAVYTVTEQVKLENISPNANVFKLRVGSTGSWLDGQIQIEGGRTLRVVHVPTVEGREKRIRLDTTFPPDKIHEHKYFRQIVKIDNNIGQIPGSDEYIAGSLQIYINGIALSALQFSEEVDSVTGKRTRFRLAPSVVLNIAKDFMWVSYEVKPNWQDTAPDPLLLSTGRPQIQRWIRDSCLGGSAEDAPSSQSIIIPYNNGERTIPSIWMIDITDFDLKVPYDMFQLFVNGTLVHYDNDWDIVSFDNKVWLRWRYPVADSEGNIEPISNWFNESYEDGDEATNVARGFATFNLEEGWELVLYYFGNWPS